MTAKQTENQTITLLRSQFATTKDKCTRAFCKAHLDSAIFREKIKERSAETIANIAITLIHQCDILIRGLIEWKKRDFIEKGGIKEEMYRARKDWQKKNGAYGAIPYEGHGYDGVNGYNGIHGQKPNQPKKPTQPRDEDGDRALTDSTSGRS